MKTIYSITTGFFLLMASASWSFEPESTIDAKNYRSLQAALDAAVEGSHVQLPAGTFEITKPLTVQVGDLRIEGMGTATHIVNKNTQGEPALILAPKGIEEDSSKRLWRVQLADFRISGSTHSGDGVKAVGINEIYIHGLSVDHNGGNGIHLIDCYEDPRISDSILTYNAKTGLRILRGHDIVVNANQFEENQDALQCIDSFNLCMNGNNLDDHLQHGVVMENTYGSVISGNMIEECQGYAIVVSRDCYGNTYSSNVLAHNFSGGIHFQDAWGCTASANTFTMDTPYGIVVESTSGRIAITGNNFSNAYIGGKTKRDDAAGGIHLKGAKHITITGNIFTGLSTRAVLTEGDANGIVIQSNVMADPFSESAKKVLPINLTPKAGIRESNYIERNKQ